MSTKSRTSRPKSVFGQLGELGMKSLTSLFNSTDDRHSSFGNAPPTPPPLPSTPDMLGTFPADSSRRRDPALAVHLSPSPPSQTAYGRSASRESSVPQESGGLAPPHLYPLPPSPLIPPSPVYSRPGTSGGLTRPTTSPGAGANLPPNNLPEAPRLRKKRKDYGRKKRGENQSVAWKLVTGNSTTDLEPYDFQPLLRGGPAKELWFADGDTLVFLASKDNKNAKPVFRIHSCPLMYTALGGYIQDENNMDQPADNPANTATDFTPNDLFLDVPGLSKSSESAEPDGDLSSEAAGYFEPASARILDIGLAVEDPVAGLAGGSPVASSRGGVSSEGEESHRSPSTVDLPAPLQAEVARTGEREAHIFHKIFFPVQGLEALPFSTQQKRKNAKDMKAEAEDHLQRFIDARNLFAFLCGVFVVATTRVEHPFIVFDRIRQKLGLVDLRTDDLNAASKHQMAEQHLQTYIDDLRLDDIRNDDDLIVEALMMGEEWRCPRVFHEGFIHAVGRWPSLSNHRAIGRVSASTKRKLQQCSAKIERNLDWAGPQMTNFDFPSVWIGEGRYAEYKGWKSGYERMRSLILSHMKHVFGSWPPKAGKQGKGGGDTELGGLNRMTLKRLYDDLCAIYDLTVDRDWLHGERIRFEERDGAPAENSEEAKTLERHRITMRKIMREYDSSAAPPKPEMPFDLPLVPYRLPGSVKKKKMGIFGKSNKKVGAEEMVKVLNNSYNQDALELHSSNALVKSFMAIESEHGAGKGIEDLAGARRGGWIFMYCVLQVLPFFVVDGLGLLYGNGVEYFLCESFKGLPPWEKNANKRGTRAGSMYLGASTMGIGGTSLVDLSVSQGDVDLTFDRSHCWVVAEDWRLVEVGPDDEDFDDYGSNVGYAEYIPGQEVPASPPLRSSPGAESATSYDYGAIRDSQRLDLDGHQGYLETPIDTQYQVPWPRQSTGYYNHPQYQPASFHQRDQSMSPPQSSFLNAPRDSSQSPISAGPTQPFDFDLSPLNFGNRAPVPPAQTDYPAISGGVRQVSWEQTSWGQFSARTSLRKSSAPGVIGGGTGSGTSTPSPARGSPVIAPQYNPYAQGPMLEPVNRSNFPPRSF